MRRYILFPLFLLLALIGVRAQDSRRPERLSFEDFQERVNAYIARKAGLTAEESDAFFPLYNEFQDQLHELQDQAWEALEKGRRARLKEGEYREILDKFYESSLASARLEKSYEGKFLKVISATKLYKVLEAEKTFRRDMVRGMSPGAPDMDGPGDRPRR